MNLDFHYYGTYYAARLAGIKDEDASVIAYYAQFVDECTAELLKKYVKASEIGGFQPTATVQSNGEIFSIGKDLNKFTRDDKREVTKIWSSFHFLPGNLNNEVSYSGPLNLKGKIYAWNYDDEAQKEFKLLCLPNSECVVHMIEKARSDYRKTVGTANAQSELEQIGMVMHILADTWAHCWFGGTPAYFMNEVGDSVYEVDKSGGKKKLTYIYDMLFSDSIWLNKYSCVPMAPRYDGIFNLGHGRIGHIPDYSFMTYEYTPMWESSIGETRIKSNPDFFYHAFCQMVYAMKCILNNQEFKSDQYEVLDSNTKSDIETVLETRKIDTAEEWESAVKKKYNMKLKTFKAEDAFKVYESAADKRGTSLFRFMKAAREHLQLLDNYVSL